MDDDAAFCSRCGQPTGIPPVVPVAPAQRLSRPMREKKIAGVCAGFARYFGMDVTLTRVLWLVIAFGTGIGFIAYIVAWIAMPRDESAVTTFVPQQTAS
jgi:phage shock protein C